MCALIKQTHELIEFYKHISLFWKRRSEGWKDLFFECLYFFNEMGLLDVFREFAGGTSIHGLTFLVQPKSSKFTKISWALVIIGALVYASYQLNLSRICKLHRMSLKLDICSYLYHTVILSNRIFKKWAICSFAFQSFFLYRDL